MGTLAYSQRDTTSVTRLQMLFVHAMKRKFQYTRIKVYDRPTASMTGHFPPLLVSSYRQGPIRVPHESPDERVDESGVSVGAFTMPATSAMSAAPTPLPSLAMPILIFLSPCGPISGISRNASRM